MKARARKGEAPPAKERRTPEVDVEAVLAWLERAGTKKNREGMARYGIVAKKAFGVSMTGMKPLQKRIGRDHDLALALWETGWYEARMLATLIDDPALVTPAQMDHWCRGFENWADCDTACFALFDKTPHAFRKVKLWATRKGELQKRAAFALLASLALHDRKSADGVFIDFLPLVEAAAEDERNFVKKGVSWALRSIGRRNAALNAASLTVARRLAASAGAAPRWVGRDALRELTGPVVTRRLAARAGAP